MQGLPFLIKHLHPVSPNVSSLPNHPLCETISILQPFRCYTSSSTHDSLYTNYEDTMFGNSVWHLGWRIYFFNVPPVLLQTISTLMSLINGL